MSSGPELLKIFQRIKDRVNNGTTCFQNLNEFLHNCAETENKIADIYKLLIPLEYDKSDFFFCALVKNISQEVSLHQTLAKEIQTQICNPANSFEKSIIEQQKAFNKSISKDMKDIEKAVTDAEKAHENADLACEKLNGLDGSKREAQQRKIQKVVNEYQNKSNIADQKANEIQSTSLPKIHSEFALFDSNRLCKSQILTQTYSALKRSVCTSLNDAHEEFAASIASYDAEDRSSRFVARVFDPTLPEESVSEKKTPVAYAISDFRSEDPEDISFERGDEIKVLLQHSSGWWEGEVKGKKGRFPKTFIQFPNEFSQNFHNTLIAAVFLVKTNHEKKGDITLLAGDLVYVEYLYKGRCSGANLRTKKHGFFPLDCLDIGDYQNISNVQKFEQTV